MKNLSILGFITLLACCMLFVVCKSESHLENPYKDKTEKELESLSDEKYSKIIAFASPKAMGNDRNTDSMWNKLPPLS
jgi:energy-converting hydrogenase Eha subunit H